MAKKQMNIYEQIEMDIKNRILSGKLKPLEQLESENTLKDMYNVSRMTVRQALNNLASKGYLYRQKGRGTFVNNTKIEKQLHGFLGFTETMKLAEKTVKNEILKFSLIEPSELVFNNLLLRKNEKVFEVHRLRYANGEAILYEKLFIPYSMFKNIRVNDFEKSFYEYLESNKMKINYGTQKIESIKCPSELSEYFKCEVGDPILFVRLITYLDNGKPVEYVESFYLGSKYTFIQKSLK